MSEDGLRMVVIAGPNGSGKSTVTEGLRLADQFPAEYINADDIAKNELQDIADPVARNRQAATMAEERRKAALDSGEPFAFETVLSTPGKLALFDEARDKGFSVNLVFITTADAAINLERVQIRVAKGGHPVPADKIAERYERAMQLLPSAIQKSDYAEVYDNSSDERGPKLIAMKQGQHLDYDDTGMPWVTERLAKQFEARAASRADMVKLAAGESIQEAHIGPGKSYRGLIVGVTEHHALQRLADNSLVLHDRALCPPGQQLNVGQALSISYQFGPDGKHVKQSMGGPKI